MAPDNDDEAGGTRPVSDLERAQTATAALAQLIATTEAFQHRALGAESSLRAAETDARLANERVAHELHDTVAQSLVSAHRFLEAARASLGSDRPDVAMSQLGAAQAAVLEAIRDLRAVIDRLGATPDAR